MKRNFLTLMLLLYSVVTFSQTTPTGIIIKDDYYNNVPLNQICADLKTKYAAKIKFDDDLLSNVKVSYWFDNIKLEDGIRQALKGTDLKFYVDENAILHIIPKSQKVVLKTSTTKNFYKGQSEKIDFTLSGKIVDQTTGESLPFSSVTVRGKKIGAKANVDGLFTLLKVPSDTSTLIVSYIGYKSTTYFLSPQTPISNLIIELESDNEELDEVIVSAEKTEVMKANETIGMFKMTPKNIAKLPNIGDKDIFRSFQLMPGISAANQSSSGLYVRGGTPDQNLVLYDGFTVYYVDHLYGFFSAFNANPIKDVQIFKGGFDAKYGGRVSSVVEITSKDGNRKDFNIAANASLLSADILAEGPIGDKVTVVLAARRSWAGPIYNKIFDTFKSQQATPQGPQGGRGRQFASTQTVSSYFYDLNGKITFHPTAKDNISLSVYNGEDYLDNSQNVTLPFGRGPGGGGQQSTGGLNNTDLSNWGNTGGSLKWSRQWSNKLYINTLVSYSNYFNRRDNSNQITINRPNTTSQLVKFGSLESNDLKDFSFKSDVEYKISPNNQLEFGVQLSQLNINYSYSQNDTLEILGKRDKTNLSAVYFQDKIKLLDNRFIINPSLRATYYDITKKTYLEPRLSAYYQVNEKFRLKGALGQYYQFAKQVEREDISNGSRSFWLLANADYLPVTSAVHYIFGGSYETKDYLIDVEAYYKDIQNDTRYTLRFAPQVGRGLVANETFFNGTGTVKGIDVLVQKKFGNYTGWLGYTLSQSLKSIAIFSNQPFPSNFDVRNEFKSVNMYKAGRFDFAVTWFYATGKPYTSIVGGYTVKLLDGSERDFTDPSGTNANRLPASHRLDLAVIYNFKHGSLGLSVFNVYNRDNVWYKKFQTLTDDVTKEKYLSVTDVNYLGMTPNVTFSWKLK